MADMETEYILVVKMQSFTHMDAFRIGCPRPKLPQVYIASIFLNQYLFDLLAWLNTIDHLHSGT